MQERPDEPGRVSAHGAVTERSKDIAWQVGDVQALPIWRASSWRFYRVSMPWKKRRRCWVLPCVARQAGWCKRMAHPRRHLPIIRSGTARSRSSLYRGRGAAPQHVFDHRFWQVVFQRFGDGEAHRFRKAIAAFPAFGAPPKLLLLKGRFWHLMPGPPDFFYFDFNFQ